MTFPWKRIAEVANRVLRPGQSPQLRKCPVCGAKLKPFGTGQLCTGPDRHFFKRGPVEGTIPNQGDHHGTL